MKSERSAVSAVSDARRDSGIVSIRLSLCKLHPILWCFCLLFLVTNSFATIRISEIVANPSTRLLKPSTNDLFQVGSGTPWMQPEFNDSDWSNAAGPFGFGTNYSTDPVPLAFRPDLLALYA